MIALSLLVPGSGVPIKNESVRTKAKQANTKQRRRTGIRGRGRRAKLNGACRSEPASLTGANPGVDVAGPLTAAVGRARVRLAVDGEKGRRRRVAKDIRCIVDFPGPVAHRQVSGKVHHVVDSFAQRSRRREAQRRPDILFSFVRVEQ